MSTNIKNKTEDLLISAKTMIENALSDNAVQTALASYGYDVAKLQAGRALYDEAFELDLAQKKKPARRSRQPPSSTIFGPKRTSST